MSKQELIDVLNNTSEIEKLLIPSGNSFMPNIHNKEEFQIWKEELKHQLQQLKQEQLIVEILQLLDNGFKNGFTDESDFIALKSKLSVISKHLDDYFDNQAKGEEMEKTSKLKKGTTVSTAFDDYKLIKQIGSGGNGRVFSAKNSNEEPFAIKFVERDISSDKLRRFKNEIHFCEQHEHKNIIKIIDRGYAFLDEKGYVFYVMPLMKETLEDKIKAGISHDDILKIFVGILEGLKYAHSHEAIHRDIKPKNILFAEGSLEPVICDFGIAHFAEDDLLTAVETRATDRMANFYYAAPEQRNRGTKIKPQTDIYAAALILNEMFTGEIPLAKGYKTIASVNEDYKYLDNLFNQLYNQDPDARLYPEETIISEMKRLAEIHHKEQEKIKLQSVVDEMIEPDEFVTKIINIEYENGYLVFTYDKILPAEWINTIIHGSYWSGCVVGYEHNRLKKVSNTTLQMHLRREEDLQCIKSIVAYAKKWTETVNTVYTNELKRRVIDEHNRKEQERIAKIKKIEKENEMSSKINSMLSDLL